MIDQTNYCQISLLASQLRLAPDALVALCIAAGLEVEAAEDWISLGLAHQISDLAALVNQSAKAKLPPAQREEPMSTWLTPYLTTSPFLLACKLNRDPEDVLTACRESGIGPKEAGSALDVREQRLVLSKLSVDRNLAEIVGPLNDDEYEALDGLRYEMYQVIELLDRKPLSFNGSVPLEFAWRCQAYFGKKQEIKPLKALEKAAWDLAVSATQHHYYGCRLILASGEMSFEEMMACIEDQQIEWSDLGCRDRRPDSELVHPLSRQNLRASIAAIQGAAQAFFDTDASASTGDVAKTKQPQLGLVRKGDGPRCTQFSGKDFTTFCWNGKCHRFNKVQAMAIKVLYYAYIDSINAVSHESLRTECEWKFEKFSKLFRSHRTWREVIEVDQHCYKLKNPDAD